LTEIPPGLHFDEAFKGVMARSLLEGAPLQLFFESNMGEEPIAIYLLTVALGLVGQEPWVVRLPSAIVGTLTIPLTWWLGRELFRNVRPRPLAQETSSAGSSPRPGGVRPETGLGARKHSPMQGQVIGLSAALILAILYWHLNFSRIGTEQILVPFFAVLAFAALARGLNLSSDGKSGYVSFGLAGLALGGSLYTHKAGYFVPILAAIFIAYAVVVERGFLRRHWRGLLVATLVALLAALPIGIYFVTHPANFLQRPASVAFTGDAGGAANPLHAVADNLPRILGMFFVEGDANPRSNLPGRPALDPFLALLLLVGLGRSLAKFRRPKQFLPVIWLGVMLLPTLITTYAPHFGRSVGAAPATALLCALGGWTLWRGAKQLGRGWLEVIVVSALALGLVFSGFSTAWAYFHTWGQGPDLFYAHDVGLIQVADYADTVPADQDVYLTPTSRDHYTLQFAGDRSLASFDGRVGLVYPPPDRAATVIILLREDQVTLPALQRTRPDGEIVWSLADGYGQPYAAAYYLPASDTPAPPPEHPVGAGFGEAAHLVGYSLSSEASKPGDTVYLTLTWRVLAPMDANYTVFAHVLGEHNPATGGPLWAGHDSQPVSGHYPTAVWQPGETVLDVHPLTIPADAPPGDYQLEAGLYLLETMVRLPAADAEGNPIPSDAVLLGTIKIGE
jgi:4-amino-4-deoxy-L-arabinose transferase-like glycosyltransferase